MIKKTLQYYPVFTTYNQFPVLIETATTAVAHEGMWHKNLPMKMDHKYVTGSSK